MRLSALLLFTIFSLSSCLLVADVERDKQMWENAYRGNFSIVYKLAITRQVENINDELLNQFIMAYVNYRIGNHDEIETIFKGIDVYIDYYVIKKGH